MLWESARVPTAFSSSPELSRRFLTRLKQAEHVFSLFFKIEKIPRQKKRNNLFTSDHQNVNYLCSRHHYTSSSRLFCVSLSKS